MSQGWIAFWTAALAGLAWAAGYVGHCRWRPYASCRKCKGAGRFRSRTGRSWRRCRRCKGSGERIRWGRRAWTVLTRIKKSAID